MAMRHLRRIQEQASKAKEVDKEGDPAEEDEEDVDEDGAGPQKAPFNPFDLLSDEEEPPQEAEGSEQEDATSERAAAATEVAVDAEEQQSRTKPKSASKKAAKKKKKSKPSKQQVDVDSVDEAPKPKSGKVVTVKDVEEDIEAIVRELNLTTVGSFANVGASGSASTSGAAPGVAASGMVPAGAPAPAAAAAGALSVLCVDTKGLRGDEELRRIFGSDVVAAVDRQDRAAAADARRAGAAARGMAGRRRGLALKRGSLVAPKDQWPACEGGLSMEMTGSKGGVPVFRYVYSPTYRDTQARFLRCQASYDPATIAALLQQAPYHVDSLLAMHDLYRHMGENNYAEESLDRALWMLESAWHPSFQPATAACRLDYAVEENRAMFGALFRHVQALSRRGCHRAALECCKLLLALEPEDPLGALCLVDYLAVRAGRYDWLQRFVLQFEGNRSLALLPNYALALPLAAHRQQQEEQAQQQRAGLAAERAQPGASSSGATTTTTGGGGEAGSTDMTCASAHELLVGALLLHPLVLPRLVARLQDRGSAKEAYWKELLSRRLFSGATDGGSASLSHLVGLYVERSGELWKPPDLLALLRRAAEEAADVADGKVAPANGIGAADWRTLARESFPASGANEYHHLRISDFSDAVNALPREEVEAAGRGGGAMHDMGDMGDALADLQEQIILAAQEHQQLNPAAGVGAGAGPRAGAAARPMTDDQLRGANPLLMLLRSLLPWVNAGQQPDYTAEGGAAAAPAAPAGGGALQPPPPQLPPPPPPEYDENDGHLDDEDGVVRNVRR